MPASARTQRLFRRAYRALSGYDHPASIGASSADELLRQLELIDDDVPPRRQREQRHQDHKEWYCAKRYFRALAAAHKLEFPISIRKGEAPDFIIRRPDGASVGIEVTEVTAEGYQEWLTVTEGKPGPHENPPAANLDAYDASRAFAALAVQAIAEKAQKIARSHWMTANSHDLLLFNNGPYRIPNIRLAAEHLHDQLRALYAGGSLPDPWNNGPLGRVSVLIDDALLYNVGGADTSLLWPHAGT